MNFGHFLPNACPRGQERLSALDVSVNISPCEAAYISSSPTRGLAWKGTFDSEDGFGFVLVLSLHKLLCQSSVKTRSLKPVCGKLVPVQVPGIASSHSISITQDWCLKPMSLMCLKLLQSVYFRTNSPMTSWSLKKKKINRKFWMWVMPLS